MNIKAERTLQAKAAYSGLVAYITRSPGNVMHVDAEFMGSGPRVRFMVLEGEAPLRIDPQCPEGQDPGNWHTQCDRITGTFEPMLCDALRLPVAGRLTQHLAAFTWIQASDCNASALNA